MRTPRFTCVSDGYPFRRLLIVSKKRSLVEVSIGHGTPFLSIQLPRHRSVSSPGIEPDPRPSQSRVRSGTLRGHFAVQQPAEESNPVLQIRNLPCYPAHSQAVWKVARPRADDWICTSMGRSLMTMQPSFRFAQSFDRGSLTVTSTSKKDRCLTVRPRRQMRPRPESRKRLYIYFSSATFQYASLTNFDQLSIRASWSA